MTASSTATGADRPRVFVHLEQGLGAAAWSRRYAAGLVLDPMPYGYQLAAEACRVEFSRDGTEGPISRLARRALRRALGFDLVHAFRNRVGLRGADVVWTHTEREHLAVAALRLLRVMRTPVLGQTVWLWDEWRRLGRLRRAAFRLLLRSEALLTTLSVENAAVAAQELGRPVHRVPFGIDPEPFATIEHRARSGSTGRIAVLAPGNDRHRDWPTLIEAVRAEPSLALRIASSSAAARTAAAGAPPTVAVAPTRGVAETLAAFADADVVVVPLTPNLHASGITVALEGLAAGLPVVITRVGGVEHYFADAVHYAEPGDADGLRRAILDAARTAGEPEARRRRAEHLRRAGLTQRDYARRHVLLTRHLLGDRDPGLLDRATGLHPVEL